MKTCSPAIAGVHLAFGLFGIVHTGCAQEVTTPPGTLLQATVPPVTTGQLQLSANSILTEARTVSEAQLKILSAQNRNPTDWVGGTMWAGISEFSHFSNRSLEANAILEMGDKVKWQPISHTKSAFHADDDCIGQAFLDAYAFNRKSEYLAPIRSDMDALVDHLNVSVKENKKLVWSWCDALFMAPPVLSRLSNVTGDAKYIDAMDKEWWRVSEQLYDPQEHLFFRDARFLKLTTKNGKKVFWSRGNGWVFAGLARVLTWMPKDYPSRARYERQFQEMAAKLLSLQGKDGAWRTSLLDADEFPAAESSGTAFYCYGMAWGINNGLLPRSIYAPPAARAWAALMATRRPDGVPGSVQKVGDRPGLTKAEDTQLYTTGGLLMAAVELSQMVSNGQSLSLDASAFTPILAAAAPSVTAPLPATFCRYVPERADDFAWENDLTAFRAYGPAIKKQGSEGEDSGIDCWLKRVSYPVINKWYAGDPQGISYHQDHGEGYDAYSVGSSRGCGGLAIWKNGQMLLSGPYKTWKIIETTPQKSIFELSYDYNVDGEAIHEVKRVTIELGQRLFNVQSTFTRDNKPVALDIAIGITTHDGKAAPTLAPKAGWMACWEKIDGYGLGTGVVIAPEKVVEMREIKSQKKYESHAVLITKTDKAGQVNYRAGYGWEKAGTIKTLQDWQNYLAQARPQA
jgi:rhamnogalacturonyl hydrolase YesR